MRRDCWRWAFWSFSIIIFVVVGLLWGRFTRIEDSGYWRIAFSVVGWFAMFGAVFTFPNLSRKHALLAIGIAAVVVRLSFWGAPVSNDVNRYLWEGRLLWMGENPYATVADDEIWEHLRDDYWASMNTRDRMTAYPPGMELVMAGASRLWYHPQVFKVVSLIGDFWILALLALLTREFVRPVAWLGFYAFNPLVLSSFAVEAHFDSLMVAGILTALWCGHRKSWKWAWFWLGVAVQMKIMALLLVPLLLLVEDRKAACDYLEKPWKNFGRYCAQVLQRMWPFLAVLIVPSLVFGDGLFGMAFGLLMFGSQGAFNGGLYEMMQMAHVPEGLARLIGTGLFGAGLLFIFWRVLKDKEGDLFKISFWILQLLLIASPVVHFWYIAWLAWFMVLRPTPSLLVLCGTMSVYFLTWVRSEAGHGWGYSREIVVATWIPFFVLFLWEHRFFLQRLCRGQAEAAQSMSLVVPVYKEGPRLKEFLSDLKLKSPEVNEIVVVDGSGEIKAIEDELEEGVRVVTSERGRGRQIAKGVEETTGDLVTVIHADTQPKEGWVPRVFQAAKVNPEASAFALGQRFQHKSFGLLGIEILNEMRVAFGGTVFGDQTMVMRRQALEKRGGFPDQPLMEDVEVSWRMLSLGWICYLGEEWEVSATKWKRGFGKRFWQVIGLMIRYRWARMWKVERAANLSYQLFEEYYPNSSSKS